MGADNKLGGNVSSLEKWVCEGIFQSIFKVGDYLCPCHM